MRGGAGNGEGSREVVALAAETKQLMYGTASGSWGRGCLLMGNEGGLVSAAAQVWAV